MNWDIALIIFLNICMLGIGFCISQVIYTYNDTTIKVNGIWVPKLEQLSNYTGRFICINIEEVTSLSQLDETCKHEAGHEIFARECAKNFTKCEEILEK